MSANDKCVSGGEVPTRHTFLGKAIYEIADFLSADQCRQAREIIDEQKENQYIMRDKLLAARWWEILKGKLPSEITHSDGSKYKIVGIGAEITTSKNSTAIGLHLDNQTDIFNLYKLAIYVNEVSHDGGTIFCNRTGHTRFVVAPAIGKAVIFDITLHHYGAPIPRGEVKYMIGFRLLCEPM